MVTYTLTTSPPRPLHIPTSWYDLTLGQLLKLWARPDLPRLSILTDLTTEELNALSPESLFVFTNALAFLNDKTELHETLAHLKTL